MSQDALDRIADELELIRTLLEHYIVVPQVPSPPEKLMGAEAISYVDEDEMVLLEEEESRQKALGQIPSRIRD